MKDIAPDQLSEDESRKRYFETIKTMLARMEALAPTYEKLTTMPKAIEVLLASMVERSTSYVSKVVTIGYASFFATWAIAKSAMTPGQILATAILILASVMLFVANEIYNVILLNRLSEVKQGPLTLENLAQDVEPVIAHLDKLRAGYAVYQGVRTWVLRASLILAGAGFCVMMYALILNLWIAYRSGTP